MTTTTPNTRPTDARLLAEVVRRIPCNVLIEATREACKALETTNEDAPDTDHPDMVIDAAERLIRALEAASAEPRTYGDGEARYATPEAAATDSVAVRETFDEYDYVRYASYKGATRRDVIRAVLRSVGMETQEPYTVSGVAYAFPEGY